MKVNGNSIKFTYDSSLWGDSQVYNPEKVDLDDTEAKLESYYTVPFDEVLLLLKTGETLNELVLDQPAASMKDLMSNDEHHPTDLGRSAWKTLVPDSSLQRNCNRVWILMCICRFLHYGCFHRKDSTAAQNLLVVGAA